MVSPANNSNARPAWFVGARTRWGGTDDQTERYLRQGIWENGYEDRFLDLVDEVQTGDRIALKSFFTQKNKPGLPFDDRGEHVSGMLIKAIGIVTANIRNGRYLKVDWTRVSPPREWYFSTYMQTIHAVMPGDWKTDALIAFTFDNQPQDIDRFRNDPQYRMRFGDFYPLPVPNPPEPKPTPVPEPAPEPAQPYTIDSIIAEGCFLERAKLETLLQRLAVKRNLILQGPPGTGKTWLAKKLAYALIGHKDDRKVRPLQFHPNLSYEDFVRGWRPQGDGKLELVDGPFLQLTADAEQNPDDEYVMVIEEINRGNPAQIFGEMLTLLEADKRKEGEALALAYPRVPGERVHIPPNVYVIGTMNVADRSLALVDLALRRRFAFFDLEPVFGSVWRNWMQEQFGIGVNFLSDVERRMTSLNEQIADDRSLGPQFRVGHSVVTPAPDTAIDDPSEWFTQVVETEIGPLLDEYWFDNIQTANAAKSELLSNL